MISRELIEFNLFFNRIQHSARIEKEVVINYLSQTFSDLSMRMKEDQQEKMLSKAILLEYLELPILITKQIFKSFHTHTSNKKLISKQEFLNGMYNLYFASFDVLLESTFKVFETEKTGEILLEDVNQIFLYLNNSELEIKNVEKYVAIFFGEKKNLNFSEYKQIIEQENSNLFVLFLLLLYSRQPFSERSIKYFQENCINETLQNLSNFAKEKKTFCKPSEELNYFINFLKIQSTFKLKVKRRNASTNILNYDNNENILNKNITTQIKINNSIDSQSEEIKIINEQKYSLNEILDQSDYLHNKLVQKEGKLERKKSRSSSSECSILEIIEPNFETFAYKITADNKLRKFKIVVIDKDIYIYKQNQINKREFIFDRILPLHGYCITSSEPTKIQELQFYSFALISKFGNTMANIFNIFFMKIKEESISFIENVKKIINLRDIQDFYDIEKEIGKGQYGNVYLGNILGNKKEKVAIKIIKKSKLSKKEIKIVRSEIDIMKFLKLKNHPNVVKTIDIFEDKHKIYFVIELLSGGSLQTYLKNEKSILKNSEIKHIANQIAKALEFLHKNGIIHRDIKTENIMLSSINNLYDIKIVDFGLAKVLLKNEKTSENFGTLVYSAPEVLLKTPYNNKVDVWSLGILIYYLITGSYPFDGEDLSMQEIAKKICKEELSFPFNVTCDYVLKYFIKSCLHKSISKRFDVTQLLNIKMY